MSANQFTKVTRQSWGKNIFNSFIGALIGILLFFGSFVVLWMNEGKINWADVAKSSTTIDAAAVSGATEGKFVAASGTISSDEQLGDAPYLRAGQYLVLERAVEMYAWEEEQQSETKNEVGGGSTTKTTYTYTKGWTSSPQDSNTFEVPSGHANPEQRVKSETMTVAQARIGAYALNTAELEMPSPDPISLSAALLPGEGQGKLVGGYLFLGSGTLDNPQLGDLRIQYRAVPNQLRGTVFGTQSGATIAPYMYRGESSFYRAFGSDRAQAINQLQGEHDTLTWILRLVGFLMMWFGMSMMLAPITAFLNVLPFLGSLGGWAIGGITFVIALVLSAVTIIISLIAHNLIALIIILALILGGIYMLGQRAQSRQPTPAA